MRLSSLLLLFCLGNLVSADDPPRPEAKKVNRNLDLNRVLLVKEGVSISAELRAEDSKDASLKDSPCQIYRVVLQAGVTYSIQHQSKHFDAFLRLEDALGKELSRDDDSGGDLNARIYYKCTRTGIYQVIATSFNHQAGWYLLSVKPTELGKPNP